ncbi:hypothetical protein [Streptomyces sp. CBMA156]|uniref:hypothetical protein n=1 Tax=Streptomyces sp. CBMA156 TaxID=1930280 RepID=UPI0016619F42|nr:hypothetical protein [Streptomyces sp. CBMA156]MBD0673114.1 hypothetical protein [Streptomyces sp. CBMA156]
MADGLGAADGECWSGLDEEFTRQVAAVGGTAEARTLAGSHTVGDPAAGKARPLGLPLRLRPGLREELEALAAACARMIEVIAAAWEDDPRLRQVITLPESLRAQVAAARDTRVHVLRLDLLPQPDGRWGVLETNANGPGGLAVAGRARAAWRPLLTRHGIGLPRPLPADDAAWTGRWLVGLVERETGRRPDTMALLYPYRADRNSVLSYQDGLRALGVRVLHADPRTLRTGPDGGATLDGEPVRHAYAKIRLRDLQQLAGDLGPYLRALRERTLFVQNGLRTRLIGDNKLCLAVLSDPRFADLFDPADHRLVHRAVPWSRNLALCDGPTVRRVALDRGHHVLKSPLDTGGRGVVVGLETGDAAWAEAVARAVAEGWLVQEYLPSPRLRDGSDGSPAHYDLAVGAADGRLVSAFARTGHEARLNVSRSGRLHPLYL